MQVVPLTRTIRSSRTEVPLDLDEQNQLAAPSAAQCQRLRSVGTTRIHAARGNVGPAALAEIREILALLMDL
ncbi:type II toxin-antitoxin system PemK/MazF family toxin [Actinomycetota bacterium]